MTRLDERIARSPIGEGWIARMHFADACASLWIDGELVHLEDLVLHDQARDIRTPTHELTIAADVLKTRRRIAAQPAGWALSPSGMSTLCRLGMHEAVAGWEGEGGAPSVAAMDARVAEWEGYSEVICDGLAGELAVVDALLTRSETVIAAAKTSAGGRERDPLAYDHDWDDDARLDEWRALVVQTEDLPPVLQAVVAFDAWNALAVLQHAPWRGRLLSAEILRRTGLSTAGHLIALSLGLKTVPVERRRHQNRNTRLSAILHGLSAVAELGLREHDRLALARTVMERRLIGRRVSSKLPKLIDLVIARPLVSADMIADALEVTPQAALRIVRELGLREMTGRGRFRAWGIL